MMVSLSFGQDTTSLFPENLLQELCRKQTTQISIPPIWTPPDESPHGITMLQYELKLQKSRLLSYLSSKVGSSPFSN